MEVAGTAVAVERLYKEDASGVVVVGTLAESGGWFEEGR